MLARKCSRGTARRGASLALKNFALGLTLILVPGLAIHGCHSGKTSASPSIEFTKIPPAAQGGRERTDTIAGRVRNARPGQQIVIYAHSGPWWVQPWPDKPFI